MNIKIKCPKCGEMINLSIAVDGSTSISESVIAVLKQHPGIPSDEMAKIIGCKQESVPGTLAHLVDKGEIESEKRNGKNYYSLAVPKNITPTQTITRFLRENPGTHRMVDIVRGTGLEMGQVTGPISHLLMRRPPPIYKELGKGENRYGWKPEEAEEKLEEEPKIFLTPIVKGDLLFSIDDRGGKMGRKLGNAIIPKELSLAIKDKCGMAPSTGAVVSGGRDEWAISNKEGRLLVERGDAELRIYGCANARKGIADLFHSSRIPKYGQYTKGEIADAVGLTLEQASDELAKMCNEGTILRDERDGKMYYRWRWVNYGKS